MSFDVPVAKLDEWLSELKPYQKNTISELLKHLSPEEAAEKWITASGSGNIIPFGGARDTRPFWDRFQDEFKKFLCDEKAYANDKKALFSEGPIAKALLISIVSAAIGATIGYTATLLAPAVAILLFTIGKIGLNAYCNGP